jgi:hypothetical protein
VRRQYSAGEAYVCLTPERYRQGRSNVALAWLPEFNSDGKANDSKAYLAELEPRICLKGAADLFKEIAS